MHDLTVVVVDLDYLAADTCADGIYMAIDLRVVGVFPLATLPPEPPDQNDGNQGHQKYHRLCCWMLLKKAPAVFVAMTDFRVVIFFVMIAFYFFLRTLNLVWLGCRWTHRFFTCQQITP